MKTFLLLFCTSVFSLSTTDVFSQNAKINIDADKTVSVDEVFDMIRKQTKYTFLYHQDLFKEYPKVQLKKGIIRANKLLQMSLPDKDFVYNLSSNNTIIIEAKAQPRKIQQIITGKVTDAKGEPLPGVTVLIKNTRNGVATDFEGNFKIEATQGNTIEFSFVGFETKEFVVNGNIINVTLVEGVASLDEVVIVGYGSVKRKDVTGSVSSLKSSELVEVAPTSFEEAIAGRAPGVFVAQTSGRPGEGIVINIRGVSSILGYNQPLYVIDGIPIDTHPNYTSGYGFDSGLASRGNPLAAIDPNDILSLDILKDASSAAIYGSRAANGVVIVTTKQGKKNQKASISINSSLQISNILKSYDTPNAQEYKENLTLAAQNYPNSSSLKDRILNDPTFFGNANTNWMNKITRQAATKNLGLGLTGGSEKSIYSFNFNLTDQEGILLRSGYKRYAVRTNLQTTVSDFITLGTNISISSSQNLGSQGLFSVQNAIQYRPDIAVFDQNGDYATFDDDPNPVAALQTDYKSTSQNVLGNIFATLNLSNKLTFKTQLNVSIYDNELNSFRAPFVGTNDDATLAIRNSRNTGTTFDNTLTYKNTFKNKHNVDAVLGSSYYKSQDRYSNLSVFGFADYEQINNAGAANEVSGVGGGDAATGLASYFGRVNYNFDNKYYATFTYRTDGSSKFGPNNKWGQFPSAALAWNISEESFLKESEWIDNIKLRTSYGLTGLANVSDFLYNIFFAAGYTYNNLNGIAPIGIPNPDIQWQRTKQLDIATDFSFFQQRLSGSFGYFQKNIDGLILNRSVLPESGFTSQSANVGKMNNRGFELVISGDIIRKEDFIYTTSFNFTAIKNKIVDLEGGFPFSSGGTSLVEEGQPLGTIRGYRVEGIIQDQAEIDALNAESPNGVYQNSLTAPGDYKFKDFNEDGRITSADTEVLGNMQPDFYGGMTHNLRYKNFDFSMLFQYTSGNYKVWESARSLSGTDNVISSLIDDAWSPQNTDGTDPRIVLNDPNDNDRISNKRVLDASYIRLKNIRIGYRFPDKITELLKLSRLNVYASMSNLFTITNYPGLDPETSRDDGRQSFFNYTDADEYPLSRDVVFGINIQF